MPKDPLFVLQLKNDFVIHVDVNKDNKEEYNAVLELNKGLTQKQREDLVTMLDERINANVDAAFNAQENGQNYFYDNNGNYCSTDDFGTDLLQCAVTRYIVYVAKQKQLH